MPVQKPIIITYYNKGKFITSNVLTQPPDVLSDHSINIIIAILIRQHQQHASNAKAVITQGQKVLRTVNFDDKYMLYKPP